MRKLLTLLAVLVLPTAMAIAQTKVITGKITDQQGVPVPFASIRVKGTKTGSSADADGNYRINVRSGATLIFSGVGMTLREAVIGDESVFNTTLTRANANVELSTVTVTALGIRRQAKELGYSTAKISDQELTQAKVTNIANGLAGKVSGLQINLVNNGVKPDTRITLRGNRSILGNNQALLVVDDIQLPISYISTLNPNDVDNVSVLKGGSASALYGSAASNGVIIITTKRGAKGKPVVRVSSTITREEIAYTPKFQNQFGQYGGENDPNAYPGIVAMSSNPYIYYVPYENQSYGPAYNGQKVPIGSPIRIYKADGTYTIKQDSGTYSALPNAKKDFFDKALTFINDISYATSDEKSKFFLSFQDVNAKGVIPGDANRRNTIRVNGSREYGIFSADYTIGYTLSHINTTTGAGVPFTWGSSTYAGGYAGGGSYFQNRPVYWTIINTPANIDLRRYKNWRTDPFASPDGYFNAYYGNPWWQIDQSRLDEKSNNLIASVALNLKPTNWLNLRYRAGIARNDYSNKFTQAGYTFAPWAIADTLGAGNIPSGVKKLSPSEGDGFSTDQRLNSDFLASAAKTFGDFDVKLIAGTSLIDYTFRALSTSSNSLVISDFYNISNRVGNASVGEFRTETRTLGVFGDLTLGYKNWLFLHGSARNDWTSLLSQANRSYLYPAVDASFVFTDAIPSLHQIKWLNFGKIRAAYSRVAQVSIDPYSLQNVFNTGPGFPYNVPGFTVSGSYANPDIKPEFSTDKEVGIELAFWDSRINFGAAYYNTLTDNQTIPISISGTTGFTKAYVNSGEMTNKGVELDLKITPVRTQDFRWDLGVNYAYNENKVKSLGFGLNQVVLTPNAVTVAATSGSQGPAINSYAIVGKSYPVLKGSDWARDPQGRIIVDTKTGYPTLDPNPKVFGTTNPPTKIGLTTSFRYKAFTLNAVLDGRFGAVIFNSIGPSLDFTGVSWYSAQYNRQPFVIPNSSYLNSTGKYVANTNINTQDGNNLFWANVWNTASSNYVNSADFWKLREVSLSFDLPKKWLDRTKLIRAASVALIGRNLVTWRAKENIWSDPEFSNNIGNAVGTTDINQLPPTRFYGANLTITF